MTLTKSNKKTKSLLLSKRQKKILEHRINLYENPRDKKSIGFYTQLLTMATFPHKSPSKKQPLWCRKNNNYTLKIQQGWEDPDSSEGIGFPSGSYPRLLVTYIIEQAVKTKSRKIYFGNISHFMREIGLDPNDGRQRRILKDQMKRLFRSYISFEYEGEIKGKKFKSWQNINIASGGFFFWEDRDGIEDIDLEKGYILLTKEFFEAIIAFPLPIDLRIVQSIKNSPLALDLYMWVTAKVYQVNKGTKNSLFTPWDGLHLQMGAEYKDIKDFIKRCKKYFTTIKENYQALDLRYQRAFRGRPGGVLVYKCNPSVIPVDPIEKEKKRKDESTQKKAALHVPPDPKYWKHNPALKDLSEDDIPQLSESAIRHVIMLMQVYNKDYDIHKIVEDWLFFWNKKGRITLKYPDKAFTAFAKKSFSSDY